MRVYVGDRAVCSHLVKNGETRRIARCYARTTVEKRLDCPRRAMACCEQQRRAAIGGRAVVDVAGVAAEDEIDHLSRHAAAHERGVSRLVRCIDRRACTHGFGHCLV